MTPVNPAETSTVIHSKTPANPALSRRQDQPVIGSQDMVGSRWGRHTDLRGEFRLKLPAA
jgi:hypothetical protein